MMGIVASIVYAHKQVCESTKNIW